MAEHDERCAICLESLNLPGWARQALPCSHGHLLHEHCVRELRRYGVSFSCPLCREQLEGLDSAPVLLDKAVLAYRQKSYEEAYRLASEAFDLDENLGPVQNLLGIMSRTGNGVTLDHPKAEQHLRAAIKNGFMEAWDSLGDLWQDRSEQGKARACYEAGHRNGSLTASAKLADMCIERNELDKAERLCALGCMMGHSASMEVQALVYMCRRPQNLERAEQLLFQAFRQDSARAALYLHAFREAQGDEHGASIMLEAARSRGGNIMDTALASLGMLSGPSTDIEEGAAAINSRISNDLLSSRVQDDPVVVLLKFNRPDKRFRDAIFNALSAVARALENADHPVELASGAKVFTHPSRYEAVVAAIQRIDRQLHKDCVILDPELEEDLVKALEHITHPKKNERSIITVDTCERRESPAPATADEAAGVSTHAPASLHREFVQPAPPPHGYDHTGPSNMPGHMPQFASSSFELGVPAHRSYSSAHEAKARWEVPCLYPVPVKRTFIHYRLPSSQWGEVDTRTLRSV